MHRCIIGGKAFTGFEELEEHSMMVHNSYGEEPMLLRKASEEEKGPQEI
jgi:hypothetical protein